MAGRRVWTGAARALAVTVLLLAAVSCGRKGADAPQRGAVPGNVMASLRARFPGAEIRKWTRETEDGVDLYDIEFVQEGRNLEADIGADGVIRNWEREVSMRDLPAAVAQAVARAYPDALIDGVMATSEVRSGADVPSGFEVTLTLEGGRQAEITVAQDGTVLERSEKPQ